jgi:hypothetical protein
MDALRTTYKYWSALVFLGVLAQVGAAGYGTFYVTKRLDDDGETLSHKGFEHGFDFHAGFGYIVIIGMLVLLAIALVSRMGSAQVWWPLVLAVAGVVQVLFAELGRAVPGLGFFHPLNALLIFALSGLIAHRAWRGGTASA